MENVNIPVGYFFTPTGQQLIHHYLLKEVLGEPLPSRNHIVVRDLYGLEPPWESLKDSDPWLEIPKDQPGVLSQKVIYVFTTLKNKGKGSRNKSRIAGCGCWDGETKGKAIVDTRGQEIGRRHMLSYECSDEKMRNTRGSYTMHQYSLTGSSLKLIRQKYPLKPVPDLVLCKITLDKSKPLKIKKKKNDNKEEEASGVVGEGDSIIQGDETPSSHPDENPKDFTVALETDQTITQLPKAQLDCIHAFAEAFGPMHNTNREENYFDDLIDVADLLAICDETPSNKQDTPDLTMDIDWSGVNDDTRKSNQEGIPISALEESLNIHNFPDYSEDINWDGIEESAAQDRVHGQGVDVVDTQSKRRRSGEEAEDLQINKKMRNEDAK